MDFDRTVGSGVFKLVFKTVRTRMNEEWIRVVTVCVRKKAMYIDAVFSNIK